MGPDHQVGQYSATRMIDRVHLTGQPPLISPNRPARTNGAAPNRRLPYGAGGGPCFLNTASIAAWAHFSPSALDTPIEPITSPSTTIGKAPGCGKSCMKVGARFCPLRTILFISEVGRRQRSADFAFSSAVSMELAAAPSMAWDSIRFPAQSNTDIASVMWLRSAQAVQASTMARAPALEMTFCSRTIA